MTNFVQRDFSRPKSTGPTLILPNSNLVRFRLLTL